MVSQKRGRLTEEPRPRRNSFSDDWDVFVDHVRMEIQACINLPKERKKSPYFAPSAVLKREVYDFVHRWRGKVSDSQIQEAIDVGRKLRERSKKPSARKDLRSITKSYKEEPFYWVLLGLSGAVYIGEFEIKQPDVSRYALQLNYAERHHVPTHYLVGFFHQIGGIAEVCRRARRVQQREEWHP